MGRGRKNFKDWLNMPDTTLVQTIGDKRNIVSDGYKLSVGDGLTRRKRNYS